MAEKDVSGDVDREIDTTAIAPKRHFAPVPFLSHIGTDIYASIDPKNKSQVLRVLNAMQAPAQDLSEYIGETLLIQHVVMYAAQSTVEGAREGEMYRRIILKTVEGKMLISGSQGVYESLMAAVVMHGTPPWREGIQVIPRQRMTGNKRKWPYLQLVEPKEEENLDSVKF